MRYISVFSGIEAASVAFRDLGWEPVAFSEIDPFPSAVLAHRFTDVENLGDITKVDWKEVIARHGRPDVVVGGSPCQSFSVAGGRESLSGESRLMFEYIRALDEIRPRWFLWENVPGVLNTRDNAFAQLLGEVQKLGYGSLAWRVLDAQFFGVAQRRRRVFLVGRLGEGGSAAAVLFEPESVRGDNPSSREKREVLARAAGRGPAGGCGDGCFAQNTRNEVRLQGGDGSVTGPIAASSSAKGQGVPFVVEARSYRTNPLPCPLCGADAVVTVDDPQEPEQFWRYSCGCSQLGCDNYGRMRRSFGNKEDAIGNWNGNVLLCNSIDYKQTPKVNDNLCHTLTHEGDGGIHSAVVYGKPMVMATGQANAEVTQDMTPTLNCAHEQPIVVIGASTQYGDEVAGTLTARADSSPCADRGQNVVCMADDTANAAIDEDMCGTLKVGGAPPLVAAVTDKK